MKTTFKMAMETDDLLGENLMPTHSTSGNSLVDLFFTMGASRELDDRTIIRLFEKAFSENTLLATKSIFYNRDIRGGQGERRSFRIFFNYLANAYPDIAIKNLANVAKYGRWDDIFSVFGTPAEADAIDLILSALKKGDKLCAKWMPRDNKAGKDIARKLMKAWELSAKSYRKLLSGNTQVVENLMCKNQWGDIKYSAVPSMAMNLYRKAFSKHDAERFVQYLENVTNGTEKISAGAIFPHVIVHSYGTMWGIADKVDKVLEEQWKALPDYMPKGEKILPICDVSGSMTGQPMEVSVALGIYLSERNIGPFQNMFITFSGRPALQTLTSKTLRGKIIELEHAQWDMNTNLEAVFKLVLDQAVKFSLSEDDMPRTILILSDMQFDECIKQPTDNSFTMIKRMYSDAGYVLPQIIFWNLRTSTGIPVKFDERGTALVSGFSPSIMKNILEIELSPIKIVLKTLNSDRYASVIV